MSLKFKILDGKIALTVAICYLEVWKNEYTIFLEFSIVEIYISD